MADEWNEWRKHILISMEKQETDLKEVKAELSLIKQEIAVLKLKSGAWGAVAGAVIAVSVILMRFI